MAVDPPPPEQDLNKVLNDIDKNATDDQVEKLRLLAAAVVSYGNVSESWKKTPEIYQAINTDYTEEPNAVSIFKRLLLKAGYPRRHIEKLSIFTAPSQPTPDMPKLYFYELLVKVADQIGRGEYFRYLRNRIPRMLLDMNRDKLTSCIHLFQVLEMKRVLDPKKAASSLGQLEQWLKDINRNDVAELVRERIDEIGDHVEGGPPAVQQDHQGGIQPSENEQLTYPVQETAQPVAENT